MIAIAEFAAIRKRCLLDFLRVRNGVGVQISDNSSSLRRCELDRHAFVCTTTAFCSDTRNVLAELAVDGAP
jgi:hypothetical protein